ncbi:uncharacterized protein LOC106084282 [Stomoxys calcitrans]|uniref:uncharacterized protein LOC106084282 n=1 Tax=Stomoxys calcitrans TaxID=35570 RepID=UPI0027E28D47|nr:uncharacterized protein LOC106084282 [Stomoxys calcitrans]
MKLYALLVIVAAVGCAQARCKPGDLPKATATCLQKTKAMEIDILDLLLLKNARNDNAKCFRSCLMTECEFMDEKGNIVPELSKIGGNLLGGGDPARSSVIEAAISYCLTDTKFKGDSCDFVENLFLCSVNKCKECKITLPKLA